MRGVLSIHRVWSGDFFSATRLVCNIPWEWHMVSIARNAHNLLHRIINIRCHLFPM
jgi:hypothetical protein